MCIKTITQLFLSGKQKTIKRVKTENKKTKKSVYFIEASDVHF